MASRVTETRRLASAARPQQRGVTARPSHSREVSFASLSRELRCTLDDEGRFLHVEGAWRSVVGWDPGELRGRHWQEVVHPADRTRVASAFARLCATGGRERKLETRIAVRSGGHRPIDWSVIAGAGPDRIIAIGRERSDEREEHVREAQSNAGVERHNRELLARIEELEERNGAIERFAGTAAHQLAEPLVIAESSAILVAEELGEDLDPLLRDRLDAIGRGAARARRLMDALLADARSAALPISPVAVDVAEVARDTLAALGPRIAEQRTVVNVGELPRVRGDRMLLAVVLDNLVDNALKHGPRAGSTITIGAEPAPGGWRLSVTSGGPPIAEEDARRIFEPYLRLPGERRISGNGLGLAICARLVERMGGALAVTPGAEHGNTFHFALPAA
jgi:PAS domain S-box-containing protein